MAMPHPALRDPDATWRARRALPLSEVLEHAAVLELRATVEFYAVTRTLQVDIAVECTYCPAAVAMLSREPHGILVSALRQLGEDFYEVTVTPIPRASSKLSRPWSRTRSGCWRWRWCAGGSARSPPP